MLVWFLDALVALAVLLTLLPLLRRTTWWVRVWDFPRLQIAALLVAAGAGRLLLGPSLGSLELGLGGLAAVSLALQAWWILPFTPLWRPQVLHNDGSGWPSLSLLVVNVLMENREADGLLATLAREDPDLVLVLEADAWWAQRLDGLRQTHPHTVLRPQDNTYGMLLYARPPLEAARLRFLLSPEIPSIHTFIRLEGGRLVEFWGVHPAPPVPLAVFSEPVKERSGDGEVLDEAGGAESSLSRDAELIMVAREIAARPSTEAHPAIVAGDLNDVAWSHTTRRFLRLSGMLDPRVGRGFFNSFHAGRWPLRWPLDHVFHGPDWGLRRMVRLPAFGSDHFPFLIELGLKPGIAAHQEAPPAEPSDHAEARTVLAEAQEDLARGTSALPGGTVAAPVGRPGLKQREAR